MKRWAGPLAEGSSEQARARNKARAVRPVTPADEPTSGSQATHGTHESKEAAPLAAPNREAASCRMGPMVRRCSTSLKPMSSKTQP